jgi:hypothetical protein
MTVAAFHHSDAYRNGYNVCSHFESAYQHYNITTPANKQNETQFWSS